MSATEQQAKAAKDDGAPLLDVLEEDDEFEVGGWSGDGGAVSPRVCVLPKAWWGCCCCCCLAWPPIKLECV